VDEPNPGALMKAAIDAMLYELDPYTNYIPESQIEDFKLMSTGQYGGIGAIIRQNKKEVMVIDPQEGFPAQKAGLTAGDVFLEIDGRSVVDLTSEEVSEKLKDENSDIQLYTINAENNRDIAVKYGVRGVPTIKVFNDGDVVNTKTGVQQESQLIDLAYSLK
jgi:C-terminal processing protease CtpA/Prc